MLKYNSSLTAFFQDYARLTENKDRLIDTLNLTPEQKARLKDFFHKHPNYESKVDWNRRDLAFRDFEGILALEGKSRNQAKKTGITGLKEGIDYQVITNGVLSNPTGSSEPIPYTVYYPLNHLGSQTLANNKVAPVSIVGEWCISANEPGYWRRYVQGGYDFFFVCINGPTSETQFKYAFARRTRTLQDGLESLRVTAQELPMPDFNRLKQEFNLSSSLSRVQVRSADLGIHAANLFVQVIDIFTSDDSQLDFLDLAKDDLDPALADNPYWQSIFQELLQQISPILLSAPVYLKQASERKLQALKANGWKDLFLPNGELNSELFTALYESSDITLSSPIALIFPENYPHSVFPSTDVEKQFFKDNSPEDFWDDDSATNPGPFSVIDMSKTRIKALAGGALTMLDVARFIPPKSLEVIGENAFGYCSAPETLDLRETAVKEIHPDALIESGIRELYLPADYPLNLEMLFEWSDNLQKIHIDIPKAKVFAFFQKGIDETEADSPNDISRRFQYFEITHRNIPWEILCSDGSITVKDISEKFEIEEPKPFSKVDSEDDDKIPF